MWQLLEYYSQGCNGVTREIAKCMSIISYQELTQKEIPDQLPLRCSTLWLPRILLGWKNPNNDDIIPFKLKALPADLGLGAISPAATSAI
jgi:hypothetical protein